MGTRKVWVTGTLGAVMALPLGPMKVSRARPVGVLRPIRVQCLTPFTPSRRFHISKVVSDFLYREGFTNIELRPSMNVSFRCLTCKINKNTKLYQGLQYLSRILSVVVNFSYCEGSDA